MNKLFNRMYFTNGGTPALSASVMNAIAKAIDDIDTRVTKLFGADIALEKADDLIEAAERAVAVSGVDLATTSRAGLVKPDGTTITVNNGTITANTGSLSTRVGAVETSVGTLTANLTSGTNVFRYSVNGEGKHGYLDADDSFHPFKSIDTLEVTFGGNIAKSATQNVSTDITDDYIVFTNMNYTDTSNRRHAMYKIKGTTVDTVYRGSMTDTITRDSDGTIHIKNTSTANSIGAFCVKV